MKMDENVPLRVLWNDWVRTQEQWEFRLYVAGILNWFLVGISSAINNFSHSWITWGVTGVLVLVHTGVLIRRMIILEIQSNPKMDRWIMYWNRKEPLIRLRGQGLDGIAMACGVIFFVMIMSTTAIVGKSIAGGMAWGLWVIIMIGLGFSSAKIKTGIGKCKITRLKKKIEHILNEFDPQSIRWSKNFELTWKERQDMKKALSEIEEAAGTSKKEETTALNQVRRL